MWHDQGKWVTCRQYPNLSFQYNLFAPIKSYILIHTPLQSDIWCKRYEQFLEFQNNVTHRNMSSVLSSAYNSKSILATSDSFPLIMSHIISAAFLNNINSIRNFPLLFCCCIYRAKARANISDLYRPYAYPTPIKSDLIKINEKKE